MISYLVYDTETLRVPYESKYPKKVGIEYSKGWRDYKGLGVSVVACYSSISGFHLFSGKELFAFEDFASNHDTIAGFNSSRFDDLLLQAQGIKVKTTYDLMVECWRACKLDPNYTFPEGDWVNRKKYSGFKLETLAIANFGRGKLSSGSLAPEMFQKGQYKQVATYCFDDVTLTRDLIQLGLQGRLWHPKYRKFLKLRNF